MIVHTSLHERQIEHSHRECNMKCASTRMMWTASHYCYKINWHKTSLVNIQFCSFHHPVAFSPSAYHYIHYARVLSLTTDSILGKKYKEYFSYRRKFPRITEVLHGKVLAWVWRQRGKQIMLHGYLQRICKNSSVF